MLQCLTPNVAEILVALAFLLLASATDTGANGDSKWAKKLLDVIKARDAMMKPFISLSEEITTPNMENVIATLQKVSSQINGLDNLNINTVEKEPTLVKKLFDQAEEPMVKTLFRSNTLESHYKQRGLGFMLKTFRGYHSLRCIQAIISGQKLGEGYDIPIEAMCSRLKEDIIEETTDHVLSTAKICQSVKQCSGSTTPFPYGDNTDGTDIKVACTEDNKCDVGKALPLMSALLWYKISNFMARSLCHNSLPEFKKSSLTTKYEEIKTMATLMVSYTSTLHWNGFFREAASQRAYSNLETAMSLINKRITSMEFTSLACIKLEATDMCTLGDIYKLYGSLLKLKKNILSPGMTKNLRQFTKVDHSKMLQLKTSALKHLNLLGEIRSVDENLQASVKGISKYFYGLAKFDEDIAKADVTFISDKLSEFRKKSDEISKKVEKDIQNAMAAMVTVLAGQLVEESVILSLKIAEHTNPLKVIFGGVEVGDIYEQLAEVARAAQELTHGVALRTSLVNVIKDSADLAKDFKDNANQISSMQTLVKAIEANKVDEIGYDADKFIKAYSDYTPKVNRARLAKNDALWATFKSETCDLLFGAQGAGAALGQGVVGGMLLCERLEGTLAKFSALRENVFDFQFDLVDSLAAVIRGNVGKKLSTSIDVLNDVLESSKLMLGFFITQHRLQHEAAVYCDKIEYRLQGKRLDDCSPSSGFFSKENLDNIISFDLKKISYFEENKFVYLPTKPQFKGDTGFINIPSLAQGNSVTFRIPANRTWLRQYNWLGLQENSAPFVESFKMYLPLKRYGRKKKTSVTTRTSIELTSIAGSMTSDTSDVVYSIPLEHSKFLTVYYLGYRSSQCSDGNEISNPYSLCKNLPNICDTFTKKPQESLMPTILSTWKLSYTVESGNRKVKWKAPNPATNLLIKARVKLRHYRTKKSDFKLFEDNLASEEVCCKGNTYQPEWYDSTCVPCPQKPDIPTNSKSKLGGYYCEKGKEKVVGKLGR